MAEPATARGRSIADILFAAVLLVTGLTMAWMARDFSPQSARYPQILGIAVSIGALALAAREIRRLSRGTSVAGTFSVHPGRLVLGIVALFAYILGVTTIGFILPSIAVGILLPAAIGFRRPVLTVVTVGVSVAAILLVFVVLLERPIPPDVVFELLR